jgi:hypothetical protein
MLKTFLISCICLIAWPLLAKGVSVSLDVNDLKISTSNIDYPEGVLNRELKSGLPNTIDFLIRLSQNGTQVTQQVKRFSVVYDLWDEFYLIQEIGSEKIADVRIDSDIGLKNVLSSLDIIVPYQPNSFAPDIPIVVSTQIFFNPVQSQRIKKIQNWIRTSKGFDKIDNEDELNSHSPSQLNSNPSSIHSLGGATQQAVSNNTAPSSLNQVNAARPSSGPRFKKLFDKILEQHLSEDSIAAQWKSAPQIATFSIKDIQNESH